MTRARVSLLFAAACLVLAITNPSRIIVFAAAVTMIIIGGIWLWSDLFGRD
jgi:hypothetical protein